MLQLWLHLLKLVVFSKCSPVCLPLFVLPWFCVLQCVWAWPHLLSPLALIIVHTCLQSAHPSCRSARQPLISPSACSVSTPALQLLILRLLFQPGGMHTSRPVQTASWVNFPSCFFFFFLVFNACFHVPRDHLLICQPAPPPPKHRVISASHGSPHQPLPSSCLSCCFWTSFPLPWCLSSPCWL